MPETKSSLLDKLTELARIVPGSMPSEMDASALLARLRHEYPDIDVFISRRFTRLPAQVQSALLDILRCARDEAYATSLQEWSRNNALGLDVRRRALAALETMGQPIDTAYRDALYLAEQCLSAIRQHAAASLTESGELSPPHRDDVLNLPLVLALDLGRELAPDHPTIALAVVRTLRHVVDAQESRALVDVLSNIRLPESVQTLQDILTEATEKTLQKTVKKALHRLKAQGLEIAETQQPHRTVVVGSVTHHLEKCLASHIDAVGDRVLWMIRTKALGGYYIAYLIINYGLGIKRAMGLQISKRELPGLLDQAQEHARLIELEPSYCQYQVALAHQMNLETRTPVPEEFFSIQDIIGESEITYEAAFIYGVLTDDDKREAEAYSEYAEDLLEVPEFAGWSLPSTIVQKYADQIREIEESHIVVSPALKRERLNEVYAQASEEALGEASRRIMRLRLEEMAYYLLQTDRRREALWAVAAARSLDTDDRDSLRRNPFAGALLERSLESAKAQPGSRIIQPFSRLPQSSESPLSI